MDNINSLVAVLKSITLYDALATLSHNNLQSTPNVDSQIKEPERDKFLTGKQVDEILKISSPTRHRYANDGILTRHKVSRKKILYKEEEVLKLLQAKDSQ